VHVGLFCSLATFFVTSSVLTKYKSSVKAKIEDEHKEGGQRNWVQVLCNGGVNLFYSLLLLSWKTEMDTSVLHTSDHFASFLLLASMCSFACCNGDTWASEVGPVLSQTNPKLITTWREVPKGTNGGVSTAGTIASGMGGLVVGFAFSLCSESSLSAILELTFLGFMSGLVGSAIDSVLGATVQYSGWDTEKKIVVGSPGPNVKHISGTNVLDNHLVNFTSSVITGLLISTIRIYIM